MEDQASFKLPFPALDLLEKWCPPPHLQGEQEGVHLYLVELSCQLSLSLAFFILQLLRCKCHLPSVTLQHSDLEFTVLTGLLACPPWGHGLAWWSVSQAEAPNPCSRLPFSVST